MRKLIPLMVGLIAIICFSFIIFHFQKKQTLASKIQRIPLEDRIALESFFRILMLEEGGAYVLFGDKPMAFTAYLNSCQPSVSSRQMWDYYSENQKILDGWKTWEKYQNLFPSENFILKRRLFDDRRFEICLINKSKFIKIVKENSNSFQSAIGNEITPTVLLDAYQNGNTAFFHLIKKHHALLGILLGFGTKNSWMFYENMIRIGDDPNFDEDIPFHNIQKLPSSIQKYSLEGAFKERNHKKCYKFLRLPYFLADHSSEETQALQKKYLRQRQEIHQRYAHGNFLEVSLNQICQKI